MASTATVEQNPATPEEIWAILRETAQRQREHEVEAARWREEAAKRQAEYEAEAARRQAEYDKQWREEAKRREEEAARREEEAKRREKEDARLKEMFRETKELFDKGRQEMGDLRNSFGELAEHLVAPGIRDRFKELGLSLGKLVSNVEIVEDGRVITEADLVLENTESIVVVEVKAKPKLKDVKAHERRLERMRGWHDRSKDRRRLLGVMAGAVFGVMERKAALEAGFYVLVQSGDTMKMDIPEGFVPREW